MQCSRDLYNVLPGGGEILVVLVRAIQKMGDFIDILGLPGTAATIRSVIKRLRAQYRHRLEPSSRPCGGQELHHFLAEENITSSRSDVHKIPNSRARDKQICTSINFDRQRAINTRDQSILATYQYVVLNSEYTKGAVLTYTNQTFG